MSGCRSPPAFRLLKQTLGWTKPRLRDPHAGVPLAARDEAVRQRLQSIPRSAELLPLWEKLVTLPPWQGPALWLHGDPHPGNLLLDGEALAAVLDFGDLTSGDPATDLAAAWLVFDENAREVSDHAWTPTR